MPDKLFFIFIISLFGFCQGEPICTTTNQCRDFWIAKKCNAVEHCITEDWSKLKPTGYKDDVCSICLRMVKEAREQLESNETRDELKQVLEGSCKLLMLEPAVKLCDKFADEFGEELVKILASRMDPETVCTVAKLCNNNAFRLAQKNSRECVHCQAFMEVSEEKMMGLSLERFKNEILQVCRSAGGFSDACSHMGLVNAKSLYDSWKSVLMGKPCEATLLCPSSSGQMLDSNSLRKTRSQMCPLCRIVMRSVKNQLLKVKSGKEFEENTMEICEKLNLERKICSEISSQGFYEKLKTFERLPDLFCHVVYCMERGEEDVPMWPLLPANLESFNSTDMNLFDLMAFADLLEMEKDETTTTTAPPRPTIAYGDPIENPVFLAPVIPSKLQENDGECETCQQVLDELSKRTWKDEDLDKMFEMVCESVTHEEKCKRFVEKYGVFLTRFFDEGTFSKELCTGLVPGCQVEKRETEMEGCEICLTVMNFFKQGDSVLLGPKLEENCRSLTDSTPNTCRDLSSTFVSLASVLKNSTEREACDFIELCKPSSKAEVTGRGAYCSTCMLTIQSLRDALKSNVTDDAVEEILDSFCELLPHSEKNLCYNLIRVMGVEEFKKFLEKISPSALCRDLHICKGGEDDDEGTTEITVKKGEKVPCKFCMMAIKMLLDQLGDSKTEEQIRKALDSLCNYFPEETKDTCRNLINEYTETIIDMIIADFNATEICIYLKLCPQRLLLETGKRKEVVVYDVNTNEIRDWEEYESDSASYKHEEISNGFQKFHAAVENCALCEALVGVISKHESMLKKNYDFDAHSRLICSIVPRNKLKQCKSLLVSYGPSIVNLLVDHNVDENEICVYVDLCARGMQAKVNLPVSVPEPKVVPRENDCMRGPVFWCANAENAEKCGTYLHCKETVWKTWQSPPSRPSMNL